MKTAAQSLFISSTLNMQSSSMPCIQETMRGIPRRRKSSANPDGARAFEEILRDSLEWLARTQRVVRNTTKERATAVIA
jgi:flagellar hook-basal body complex protein FliE